MPQPSGASASTVSGASAAAASETRSTTIASAPILAAFQGERPSHAILDAVAAGAPGVTLYRALNVRSASQLRDLTDELRGVATRAGLPPPIIAIDQEGGQLNAIGDGTQFPGNLALAATGSEQLAEAVGRAIGRELAALGITVNFAPDCDVLTNRDNPTVGVRSFGDDPALAARLAAAFVRGHQSQGVATTAKHFPGGGDRSVDSHYALPVVHATLDRLRRVELQPFRATIEAGCRLVMPAHLALPAIDGLADRPAMVSPHILRDLLRDELGFGGVVVSDALDMGAIDQDALVDEALGALHSGVDLLLAGPGHADRADLLTSIAEGLALRDRSVGGRPPAPSARRITQLRRWFQGYRRPDFSVVGSAEHRSLALEVARRSITLARHRDGLLPLAPGGGESKGRVVVILPRPADLTPADTSSHVRIDLADGLRKAGIAAEEIRTSINPVDADVRAIRDRLVGVRLAIVGTINARQHRGQADVVRAALAASVPTILIALRMPDDIEAYPEAGTYLCTYGIQPPSIDALVEVLTGAIRPTGRLPLAGLAT